MQRWDRNTDVAVYRRSEKILKGMDWSHQEKFERTPEQKLSGVDYLPVGNPLDFRRACWRA